MSEKFLPTSRLPQNIARIPVKKTQKRKTKKTRAKLASKPDAFDSDSSKEHFPSTKATIASVGILPSRIVEPSNKMKVKQAPREIARKWHPSPPTRVKEVKTRKKRLLVPKVDPR